MKIIHMCESTVGWQPVRVNSSSGERAYVVHVTPWGRVDENICECPGYFHRGHCRHQAEASAKLCGWTERTGPEEQTPQDRRNRKCPRCGRNTHTTIEEDDDEV